MTRDARKGFPRILALAAAIGLLAGGPLAARAFEKAPQVVLKDVSGKDFRLEYGGHGLTLVNFWAVWCLPCREEMPQIARLTKKYKGKGFRAIGVALESGDAADVKSFLEKNAAWGVDYPILMGNGETAGRFGSVSVVPTTYLIDSKGKVVGTFVGITSDFSAKIEARIEKHLHSAAPEAKR